MSEIVVKKKKKKVKVFPIVNAIIFILISLIILVPMWKVIVDSFDARAGYGMLFWPQVFSIKLLLMPCFTSHSLFLYSLQQ